MYCPNCSTEASTGQKFCRSCGMELQAVAELISGQSDVAKPERPKGEFLNERQRAMLILGMIMTLGAVAVGSSLKILGKEHIQVAGDFTPYLMVIMLLTLFFGIGLMCYPLLQMMSGSARSRNAIPKSEPTIKLKPEALPEHTPSVTEQTTEFLEATKAPINVRDTASQSE